MTILLSWWVIGLISVLYIALEDHRDEREMYEHEMKKYGKVRTRMMSDVPHLWEVLLPSLAGPIVGGFALWVMYTGFKRETR